jgi:hypothetical protein
MLEILRAFLKIVASAILADVEPWLPARRKQPGHLQSPVKYGALVVRTIFPGGMMPPSATGREARGYFSNRHLTQRAKDAEAFSPLHLCVELF